MHPAYDGISALPFYDEFDLSTVDILLISQYVLYLSFFRRPRDVAQAADTESHAGPFPFSKVVESMDSCGYGHVPRNFVQLLRRHNGIMFNPEPFHCCAFNPSTLCASRGGAKSQRNYGRFRAVQVRELTAGTVASTLITPPRYHMCCLKPLSAAGYS